MLVAYSGGLDSSVLLHAAARVFGADALVAVHVHHGLQPQADAWAQHCADQARALEVDCVCRRVRAVHGAADGAAEPASTGDGLEAWARRRRYAALEAVARARGAVAVLTAHHADDQVETVLMRIARGTGADGLTAMRAERPLSRGLPGVVLARPLLSLPRAVVRDYARDHGLRWVEDPSNRDPRMLRNAVRTQVLPALDAVAPAFRTHLLRTVAHVAVAADAARARAQDDLISGRARCGAPHRSAWPRRTRCRSSGGGPAGLVCGAGRASAHAGASRRDAPPVDGGPRPLRTGAARGHAVDALSRHDRGATAVRRDRRDAGP